MNWEHLIVAALTALPAIVAAVSSIKNGRTVTRIENGSRSKGWLDGYKAGRKTTNLNAMEGTDPPG